MTDNLTADLAASFTVTGKTALISGGARGLGAEFARVLAAAGASVMITDVLDDAGRATAESIVAAGGRADYRTLDVREEDAWARVVAETVETFGGLEILVNNAGIELMTPIVEADAADYKRLISINVDGTYFGCKHAVAAMKPGGLAGNGGSIINMSSVAGLIGVPWLSAYGAAKGAVRMLTKDVAVECGRLGYGVRCNSVHPGLVQTDMGDSFLRHNMELSGASSLEEVAAGFLAAHPIGRTGTTRDVAAAVLFLASDASSWITGVELPVDGGWSAT
ncbi:SDR family NAD(P)-dependent oxidoreductase [Gordonia sp. FQ]|uniref:SDR family NAD(P)-dependent oxidoreductase n=1 Tax=Gordonia sp. FQ TaxID=3446634 RepID=UPI003F86383E